MILICFEYLSAAALSNSGVTDNRHCPIRLYAATSDCRSENDGVGLAMKKFRRSINFRQHFSHLKEMGKVLVDGKYRQIGVPSPSRRQGEALWSGI